MFTGGRKWTGGKYGPDLSRAVNLALKMQLTLSGPDRSVLIRALAPLAQKKNSGQINLETVRFPIFPLIGPDPIPTWVLHFPTWEFSESGPGI